MDTALKGVEDRDARMRISRGIDDDPIDSAPRLLNGIDDGAFMIALKAPSAARRSHRIEERSW